MYDRGAGRSRIALTSRKTLLRSRNGFWVVLLRLPPFKVRISGQEIRVRHAEGAAAMVLVEKRVEKAAPKVYDAMNSGGSAAAQEALSRLCGSTLVYTTEQ